MKFRKKPIIIDAIQFTKSNRQEVIIFTGGQARQKYDYLVIPTLEGNHRADFNDWIIKGIKGEFYPCKPDIFKETYEIVKFKEK